MKKSLIALAVAGVVAAPAFAATSNVDVYGTVRMSVDFLDSDTANNDEVRVSDRVSRIGFKGSEDLGGGMKAIWQIEQQIEVAGTWNDTTTGFGATARNTFVGLAGGFGTVIVGRHDAPYKLGGSADLFADTAADAQSSTGIIGTSGAGSFDLRAAGTVAYVSPTFSGLHFAVALVPGEGNAGGPQDLADAYSMTAVYANGPLNASLSYQNHDEIADESAWKVNVGYTMGDLKLGATYEDQDLVGANDRDAWLVSAAYTMGPIVMKAQYGDRETDGAGGDLTRWTIGADYNLSKRTAVYALYNSDDMGATDEKTFSLGINHSF